MSIQKTSKIIRKGGENHEKAAPGATSGGNLAPRASWAALGIEFGAIVAPFLLKNERNRLNQAEM